MHVLSLLECILKKAVLHARLPIVDYYIEVFPMTLTTSTTIIEFSDYAFLRTDFPKKWSEIMGCNLLQLVLCSCWAKIRCSSGVANATVFFHFLIYLIKFELLLPCISSPA